MQTQRRGALAVVAVLFVGVVVAGFVVLASASGPVRPISDSTLSASPRPLPTFSVSETPPEQSQPSPRVLPQHDTPGWVLSLWQAVVYVIVAAVVGVILLVLVRIMRRVRLPPVEPDEAAW